MCAERSVTWRREKDESPFGKSGCVIEISHSRDGTWESVSNYRASESILSTMAETYILYYSVLKKK